MTVITRRLQHGGQGGPTGRTAWGRPHKGTTARVARRAQASPAAYAFLIVVLLASAFPLWWSFVIGSKDAAAINSGEVSLLPGGPEDPSLGLGARGAVYTVDPWRGKTRQVATGFVSATGLAVTDRGTVYVAELFGGRISEVTRHGPRTVVEVPLPAALEWDGRGLLATTNALPGEGAPPDGHLVRIDLSKGRGHGGR